MKKPERLQWLCSGVFIVNFEQISQIAIVSIFDFEQANTGWTLLVRMIDV